MNVLRKWITRILNGFAGISFLAMVLLTCWQVFTRYILQSPSTWSEELVGYLFAWMSLLGASIVTSEREHMNIPILVERFGDRGQKLLTCLGEVIAFLFSAIILVFGGIRITALAMGQMTSSLGVPIAYSIGISALVVILQTVPLEVSVVTGAQRTFVGMSKFSLTAIPFFILAGNLMNQGGIAKRLVDFVMAVLGKLPGALLVTNAGANALFGAISGSASAAAAAVGSMVKEGERELGYDPALCAASNGASAPSGLLIPPSNALITYSLASGGASVAALFLGGYVPGILWALCCVIVAVLIAKRKGYSGTKGKFSWKNLATVTFRALPALSLIVIVIGGIVAGVFTATEGSAIAVVYALILGVIYRNIDRRSFWKIVVDSAKMSGMVVFLIGVSNILGWVMAFLQIPQAVSAALLGLTDNYVVILLIMNVILLIAGTFMDVTPAILIFTPLFLPIVKTFGMHPVHFWPDSGL